MVGTGGDRSAAPAIAGRMGTFRVDNAYYHAVRDQIVLAGAIVEPVVDVGMLVDLPRQEGAPGRLPIADITWIQFQGGVPDKVALCLDYRHFVEVFDWDPFQLEGRTVEVRTD